MDEMCGAGQLFTDRLAPTCPVLHTSYLFYIIVSVGPNGSRIIIKGTMSQLVNEMEEC